MEWEDRPNSKNNNKLKNLHCRYRRRQVWQTQVEQGRNRLSYELKIGPYSYKLDRKEDGGTS